MKNPVKKLFALFALFAANVSAATLLYDFETDAERAAVPCIANSGFTVGVTNGFATSGNHALSFVCKPWQEGMDEWPSFTLPSPVADWRGFDRFVVDVVNADNEDDVLCLFVAGPDGRIQNGLSDGFRIPRKGCAQWIVSLANWPKTTAPDNIARIHFFVTRPKHFAVALDRLTLLRPGEPVPAPAGPCVWRDILPLVDADRREARITAAERAEENAHARDYIRFRKACAAARQTAPAMLLGSATSMEKIQPRGPFSAKALTSDGLSVRLAGNEYESVQLLVAPKDADLAGVKVAVEGDLAPMHNAEWTMHNDGGTPVFASSNISCDVTGYVHTTRKPPYQIADGPDRALRDPAIGWWPDPILDFLDGVDIRGLDVQSFWIRVHCPAGQPAGTYRGALVVSAKGVEPVRVPFSVRVNGFTLGRTSALPLSVAFGPCPTFQSEGPEGIAAAKARQADPLSPVNLWRRHESEWVSFLADYLIPRDNLYHRGDTNFLFTARRLKDEGRPGWINLGYWGMPASTSEADIAAWRKETIPRLVAMRDLAAELGILDLAYAYGCDEVTQRDFPEIAAAVRELKAALPGVPLCTTAQDDTMGVGSELNGIDWFVPKISKFDSAKAAASREAGHKVWWYTCCDPHAPYPNFFIECPGIEPRLLMGAQAVRYRPDGFLYYATSLWNSKRCIEDGPFTDWDPRSWTTYHGDGSWTCAGPDGTPLPTIRLENFRDGLEDYAYAKLLEKKLGEMENGKWTMKNDGSAPVSLPPPEREGAQSAPLDPPPSERGVARSAGGSTPSASWAQRAKAALAVPREVAESLTDFTSDPAVLYRWRNQMADLIEEADLADTFNPLSNANHAAGAAAADK